MRYHRSVFARWLRVTRPDDWTGRLARFGVQALVLMLVLAALLARLPASWVAAAQGYAAPVRILLALLSLASGKMLATVVYTRLPASAFILGNTLVYPDRGRKRAVKIRDLESVRVEQRPEPRREIIVVQDRDGAAHDVCPVHWSGAGALFQTLAKRI